MDVCFRESVTSGVSLTFATPNFSFAPENSGVGLVASLTCSLVDVFGKGTEYPPNGKHYFSIGLEVMDSPSTTPCHKPPTQNMKITILN